MALSNTAKRYMLFLGGCVVSRLLLAYMVYKYHNHPFMVKAFPYIGVLALLVSVGFMYQHISGTRTTGPEVFGDKIWWDSIRPVHALMYTTFAMFAMVNTKETRKYAFMPLLIDVMFGLVAFVSYHGSAKYIIK